MVWGKLLSLVPVNTEIVLNPASRVCRIFSQLEDSRSLLSVCLSHLSSESLASPCEVPCFKQECMDEKSAFVREEQKKKQIYSVTFCLP